jgi:hypothetical protein
MICSAGLAVQAREGVERIVQHVGGGLREMVRTMS